MATTAKDSTIDSVNVYASKATSVKSSPYYNSSVLGIFEKDKLIGFTYGNVIAGSDGDWLQIKLQNGKYGYLHRDKDNPFYSGKNGYIITWDSLPQISPNWWGNLWLLGRSSTWGGSDFMEWHKQLLTHYGQTKANEIFLGWWKKQTSLAKGLDARTFDKAFKDYFVKQGIWAKLYDNTVIQNLLKTGSNVVEVVQKVTNVVAETTDELTNNTGKELGITDYIKFAAIGAGLYFIIKAFQGSQKQATA